jgi:hypothetical protein
MQPKFRHVALPTVWSGQRRNLNQPIMSRTVAALSTAAWAFVCLGIVTIATGGHQFASGYTYPIVGFVGAFLAVWGGSWFLVGTIYFMTFGGFGRMHRGWLVYLILAVIIIGNLLVDSIRIDGYGEKSSYGRATRAKSGQGDNWVADGRDGAKPAPPKHPGPRIRYLKNRSAGHNLPRWLFLPTGLAAGNLRFSLHF